MLTPLFLLEQLVNSSKSVLVLLGWQFLVFFRVCTLRSFLATHSIAPVSLRDCALRSFLAAHRLFHHTWTSTYTATIAGGGSVPS